jgi:hypothetical protein
VTHPSRLDVALELAGYGWHVHPLCWPNEAGECHPECPGRWDKLARTFRRHMGRDVGKAPLTSHGWKDATADPEEVRAFWVTWPRANVGVALKPSGLALLDPDSEEAQAETLELGRPATTVRVSRNNAFIYRRPDGCPTELALKSGRSGKLDVMSLGYVVAFGEHQTGAPVYVDYLGGPSPLPGWAVAILFERQRERQAKRAQDSVRPTGQPIGIEDAELLRRMFAAENGLDIQKLWLGEWAEDPRWPSWSEADQALCNHLAWWTRRDRTRIDRLFRSSDLMREKWGGTYASSTIDKAIAWAPYGYGEEDPAVKRPVSKRRGRAQPSRAPTLTAVGRSAAAVHLDAPATTWKEPAPGLRPAEEKPYPDSEANGAAAVARSAPPALGWRCACSSLERCYRPAWEDWVCDGCGMTAPAPHGTTP